MSSQPFSYKNISEETHLGSNVYTTTMAMELQARKVADYMTRIKKNTKLHNNLKTLYNYYTTGRAPAGWGAGNGVPKNVLEKINKDISEVLGAGAGTGIGGKRKTRRAKKSKKQTRRR